MDDTSPNEPWDDDNDLGGYSGDSHADDNGRGSDLDALGVYEPFVETEETDGLLDTIGPTSSETADDQVMTLLVTVTNPPGTVSATALLSGQLIRVDLAAEVARTTEPQLAEEITVISALAQQQARAAQHALLMEFMHGLGHDRVATRGFLERELGLPSPETVLAEKARLFATRYANDEH